MRRWWNNLEDDGKIGLCLILCLLLIIGFAVAVVRDSELRIRMERDKCFEVWQSWDCPKPNIYRIEIK